MHSHPLTVFKHLVGWSSIALVVLFAGIAILGIWNVIPDRNVTGQALSTIAVVFFCTITALIVTHFLGRQS